MKSKGDVVKRVRSLFLLLIMFSTFDVFAGRSIQSVTINGQTSLTVEPGETLNASIRVLITDGRGDQKWSGTRYVLDGVATCVSHSAANDVGTETTQTFTITAPNTPGNYTVSFTAHKNTNCHFGNRGGDGSTSRTVSLTVAAANAVPSDMAISNDSVYVGNARSGSFIGSMSTTDADNSVPFSYSLVNSSTASDAGSCAAHSGNGSFSFSGGNLLTATDLAAATYEICVMTTDKEGATYKEQFSITITNAVPSAIILSSNSIAKSNAVVGATVGSLNTTDADNSSPYSYALVATADATDGGSCTSAAGNDQFRIASSALQMAAAADVGDYQICLKTTDNYGASFKQNFTITVTNQAPSDITLSNNSVSRTNANAGDNVGTLGNTDSDGGSPYTYSLGLTTTATDGGTCSSHADNGQFSISSDQLNFASDTEVGDHNICIVVTDTHGATYKKHFVISVTNNTPTDISLDNLQVTVAETGVGAAVGTLSTTDSDGSDSFSYTLIDSAASANSGSCSASAGNALFQISGDELQTQGATASGTYTVCVKSTDLGGGSVKKSFDITVVETLTATFLDKFDVQSYGNNDGEVNWASNWLEAGDDSSATSGDMQITGNQLLVSNADNSIRRGVDLSSYDTATISFDFEVQDTVGNGESFDLQMSVDGVNWTTLKSFSDIDGSGSYSRNIDTYLNANLQVRIKTQSNMDSTDHFYINNFAINASVTAGACEAVWPNALNTSSSASFTVTQDMASVTDNYTASSTNASLPAGTLVYDEFNVSLSNLNFDGTDPVVIYANSIDILNSNINLSTPNPLIIIAVESLEVTGSQIKGAIYTFDPNTDIGGSSIFGALASPEAISFSYDNDAGDENNLYYDSYFFEDADLNDECSQVALSCPDVSGYATIFSDDFDADDGNWTVTDFVKSGTGAVALWPGEDIYISNSEVQDLQYEISGGTFNIAGDVSSGGDNEYGVVLRDLGQDGYDINDIDTYSVSADMTTNASGSTNNDIGLVFGYEDQQNFYLLRWTKIADGYGSNDTFPGDHRSLDLLKVSNGTASILTATDFYADDNLTVQITVNDDGISICINGTKVLTATNERPAIGEFGMFSYDNDQGIRFDNFNVSCDGCEANLVHHYRIEHDGSGLTCMADTVSIKACGDSNCSELVATDVTGSFVSGGSQGNTALSFDSGSQAVGLSQSSATTLSLSLSSMSPAAVNAFECVNTSNGSSSCDIAFADAGYLVTIPDFVASSTSYAQTHGGTLATVQAVKADEAGTTCVPGYTGNQSVNIQFNYVAPNAGSQSLGFSTNGSSFAQIAEGSVSSQTLTFSAATSTANIYLAYPDVGDLNLMVSDPNGVLVVGSAATGSDNFNVRPASLSVLAQDSGNNDLSGGQYLAGLPFNFSIQAINLDGNVTANYNPNALEINALLAGPNIADGASSGDFYYTNSNSVTALNSDNWSSVSVNFVDGIYFTGDAHFNEVGDVTIDVRDTYSGYGLSTSGALSIGRFTPAYFSIVETVAGQIGDTHTLGAAAFSYIGESLTYAVAPSFQVVAYNYNDQITLNYDGDYNRFTGTNSFDLLTRRYTDNGSSGLFDGGTLANISLTNNTAWDGIFEFELSDTFSYQKDTTPVDAIDVDIALEFLANDLTDADGIGYDSDGSANGLTYQSYVVANITGAEVRYGRLRLDNSFGPETQNLNWYGTLEYFQSASGWVINTDDVETSLVDTFVAIDGLNDFDVENDGTRYTLDATGANTYILGHGGVTQVTPTNGLYIFTFVSPGDGNIGGIDIDIDLTNDLSWLQYDWNNDDSLDLTVPTVTVLFGRYRGNDRIIYRREL